MMITDEDKVLTAKQVMMKVLMKEAAMKEAMMEEATMQGIMMKGVACNTQGNTQCLYSSIGRLHH